MGAFGLPDAMDLASPVGSKLVYAFPGNGTTWDQQQARENLALGEIYTLSRIEIDSSVSHVWLEEVPGLSFNSVLFKKAPLL